MPANVFSSLYLPASRLWHLPCAVSRFICSFQIALADCVGALRWRTSLTSCVRKLRWRIASANFVDKLLWRLALAHWCGGCQLTPWRTATDRRTAIKRGPLVSAAAWPNARIMDAKAHGYEAALTAPLVVTVCHFGRR